jgi:hypothetical protein
MYQDTLNIFKSIIFCSFIRLFRSRVRKLVHSTPPPSAAAATKTSAEPKQQPQEAAATKGHSQQQNGPIDDSSWRRPLLLRLRLQQRFQQFQCFHNFFHNFFFFHQFRNFMQCCCFDDGGWTDGKCAAKWSVNLHYI